MSMRPAALRFGRNGPPSGAAFALVKQLLAERPRHFQEILHDGIVALGGESARSSDKVPAPGEEALKPKKGKKSKAAKVVAAEAVNPVPEGHPFVSGAYLKSRILPVLKSQGLIKRQWTPPVEGTRLASERPEGQQTVMWALDEAAWRGEKWDVITRADVNEEVLSRQGWEVAQLLAAEQRAAREAALDAGDGARTERETMAWADRPRGVTTPLERTHLNTRRARNRAPKEERAAADAAARAEAEQMAQKILASEA